MDPLTQGLLGAAIGQGLYGRRLGARAVVWGAAGGMLPDIDMLASGLGPMAEFLYHRGPTHSLWFGPAVGPLLGFALWRRARRASADDESDWRDWIGLMVLALLTHPLLDAFTTYGTQLLSPFSDARFAFDGVAIIDPFYTVPLAIAVAVGAWRGFGASLSRGLALGVLAATTGYLGYGVWLNERAEELAADRLAEARLAHADVAAYPTLLQPWLRRIVARDGEQVVVGWLSLWSGAEAGFETFPSQTTPSIDVVRRSREGRIFEWFTQGQNAARVEPGPEGSAVVEIDDLRFGLPGQPRDGLWALQAVVAEDGTFVRSPRRIRRAPGHSPVALLEQLMLMTFGG